MKASLLIATLMGLGNGAGFLPSFGRSEPSASQKRRIDAWQADAPRRRAVAAEIAEWNSKVKRRNQRFVRRQIARGRIAA